MIVGMIQPDTWFAKHCTFTPLEVLKFISDILAVECHVLSIANISTLK